MACNCSKTPMPDRIEFVRCARGFIFQTADPFRRDIPLSVPLYAFDNIHDAAEWLVEHYGAEKSA